MARAFSVSGSSAGPRAGAGRSAARVNSGLAYVCAACAVHRQLALKNRHLTEIGIFPHLSPHPAWIGRDAVERSDRNA